METPAIETSFLQQVDGSSSWTLGNTSVITSVTGPIEAKSRDEIPTAATIDLVVRPAIGAVTTREHLLEEKIQVAFSSVILRTSFPRMLIQIVVQVIEAGEPLQYNSLELAAAINSTTLALLDASIPLLGTLCAVCVAIVDITPPPPTSQKSNSDFSYYHNSLAVLKSSAPSPKCILEESKLYIINPSADDLKHADSWHTVAYELKDKDVSRLVLAESKGMFTKQQLFKVLELAAGACKQSYGTVTNAVAEKLKKDFTWRA